MSDKKAAKAYGDMARKDIASERSNIKRAKGESDYSIAVRMFESQMEVYSAYCGSDVGCNFDDLPDKVRAGWLQSAKAIP